MRTSLIALAAVLSAGAATAASAQTLSQRAETARLDREAKERAAKNPGAANCTNANPNEEERCIQAANEAAKKNNAGQKTVAAALNAGNAKAQAQDFDGAIADYQGGANALAADHPNQFEVQSALASAYRGRATKTFNAAVGPGVSQLPPAVLTSVGNDLRASLEASNKAAQAAGTDQAKLGRVGSSMRETAKLWAGADRAGVAATARPTLDTETRLFDQWAPTATPQQLAQYTPGLAFALLPKDKAAALKYADAMFDKQPTDTDTVIAYGQIVAEAKLPPADPHRTKAKAAVETTLNTGTTNDAQKVKLRNARIKLNAAT